MYRKNIRNIRAVLRGQQRTILKRLEQEMGKAAHAESFEKAAVLRDQVAGLKNIFEHSNVVSEEARKRESEKEPIKDIPSSLGNILPNKNPALWRIEGYDISNIQGTSATGSLVTFHGLKPEKSGYRKFRIKTVRGANDVAMLKEVIERRLGHSEWPPPDVMLIDGGKAQLNAALSILSERARKRDSEKEKTTSPTRLLAPLLVMALAKRREELYMPGRKNPVRLPKNHPFLLLMMHVRDEAHRFARKYYLKRHERALFER